MTGKHLLIHSGLPGNHSFKPFYRETELQVDAIILMARWPEKGHSLDTLGKQLCTVIVQVSLGTGLQIVLLGDQALNQ